MARQLICTLSSLFRDFFRWIYPNQPPSTSTLAKKKSRGMTCVLTEVDPNASSLEPARMSKSAAEAKIKESTSSVKRSGGDSSLGEKRK